VSASSARRGAEGLDPGLEAKVDFLGRSDAYAERPSDVECVETHMSWVFLTDRDAWKLKKPVRYDELDFSSRELRRRDCEDELRLNRRLTTDVYLDVVALCAGSDGGLALGGPGEPVDWLVHMRRLPAHCMLEARLAAGDLRAPEVRPAALRLARFYAELPPVEWTADDYRRHLEEGTEGDLEQLLRPEFGLSPAEVRPLVERQRAFLAERADLLERRVAEGRLVEGHGDLRPEHVCLTDPPAVIDCLEFSRELRIADPADELAFLALECERMGRPDVGRWFLGAYGEVTKDEPPPELLAFHRRYRALRRAKIAVWHLRDDDVRDPDRWSRKARRFLELAAAALP